MSEVVIRRAELSDAGVVVTVLRRSIAELCAADHHNDAAFLSEWLENKTVENVRTWIESSRTYMVVAEVGGVICGVASVGITGGILLCYVLPEVQSTGVGRALLEAMEAEGRRRGLPELWLESTVSARGFYSKLGYRPKEGAPAESSLLCKVLVV